MKFIAKTRIQHHSLIITIPSEIVKALDLDIGDGKNNFLMLDAEKLQRGSNSVCDQQGCNKPSIIEVYDYKGFHKFCLDHYRQWRRSR